MRMNVRVPVRVFLRGAGFGRPRVYGGLCAAL